MDGTPRGLAGALGEMLALPEDIRLEWIERGARRAGEFSWDRTARETLACLLEAGSAPA